MTDVRQQCRRATRVGKEWKEGGNRCTAAMPQSHESWYVVKKKKGNLKKDPKEGGDRCTAAMLQSHERWYVVKSRLCRLGRAHNLLAGRETRHGPTVNVVVLQGTNVRT